MDPCEYSNEPSGSIKGSQFPDWPFKKDILCGVSVLSYVVNQLVLVQGLMSTINKPFFICLILGFHKPSIFYQLKMFHYKEL